VVVGAAVGYAAGAATVGTTVTILPSGYTSYVVNGRTYYTVGGVYYQPVYQNGATVFVVVNQP